MPARNSTKLIAATALCSGLMVSNAALALERTEEPDEGFYATFYVGLNAQQGNTFTGIQAPEPGNPPAAVAGAPANVAIDYDTGSVFGGSIGYHIPTRFLGIFEPRVELEVNYSEADVDFGSFNGGNQTFSGGIDTFTAEISYYSDIRWSDNQKVIPYTGGGIGIAVVDLNAQYFPNNGVAAAPTFAVGGDQTAFTTHNNIGVTFRVSENFDLFTQARYQRIYGTDFQRRFIAAGANAFNADVDDDIETITVSIGARIKL